MPGFLPMAFSECGLRHEEATADHSLCSLARFRCVDFQYVSDANFSNLSCLSALDVSSKSPRRSERSVTPVIQMQPGDSDCGPPADSFHLRDWSSGWQFFSGTLKRKSICHLEEKSAPPVSVGYCRQFAGLPRGGTSSKCAGVKHYIEIS